MIKVELPILHPEQLHCKKNSKRFTVLNCGRRFGKTTLAIDLLINASKQPRYIAYCTPTYKMLSKTWRSVKARLRKANIILEKSEALKQIILINGTIIDFWSLDNEDSIRGNAYHFIIIDEVAIIKNFLNIWNNSVRPLLADYQGGAWFLSTPKGYYNDFYEICKIAQTEENEGWAYFKMPTASNPKIHPAEIEIARKQLPASVFKQEYLAEFVNYEGNLFAEAFDKDKHVCEVKYNLKENVYLSFDFNITNTAIVFQSYGGCIYALKEYHTKGWDLESVCDKIIADYPNQIYQVTGDASGNAGSAYTAGNVSAYHLIVKYFSLLWRNTAIAKSNPSHLNSRLQTNYMLSQTDVKIDSNCALLIKDLEMVVTNKAGKIDKTDPTLTHALDCFRYYLWNYHYKDFINNIIDKRLVKKDIEFDGY